MNSDSAQDVCMTKPTSHVSGRPRLTLRNRVPERERPVGTMMMPK